MRIIVLGNCHGKGGGPTHFQLLLRFLVDEGHSVLGIGIGDENLCHVNKSGLHDFIRVNQTALSIQTKVSKRLALEGAALKSRFFDPALFIAVGYGRSYAYIAQKLDNNECYCFYHELIANPPKNDPLRMHLVDAFDGIAVQSPKMRNPFLHSIRTSKPVVSLPCFADAPPFIHLPTMPSSNDPIRLAYFGRLASNKGLIQFITSFSLVAEDQNLFFDIYGSGPEEESIIKAIASHSISHRVKLKGSYPSGHDHAKLLLAYHSLILPCIDGEGLPLVLLEAMSCGLPFLTTNIGAITDCAVNNPDVQVVEPTIPALASALLTQAILLRQGKINPARLKQYYDKHYSPNVLYDQWRKMLVSPKSYFQAHG
jgi:glycosyltransferase involved in cell wall biosynthesis